MIRREKIRHFYLFFTLAAAIYILAFLLQSSMFSRVRYFRLDEKTYLSHARARSLARFFPSLAFFPLSLSLARPHYNNHESSIILSRNREREREKGCVSIIRVDISKLSQCLCYSFNRM